MEYDVVRIGVIFEKVWWKWTKVQYFENDNLISSVSSESYTPLPRLSFSPIL
jgi:hypothetical protein